MPHPIKYISIFLKLSVADWESAKVRCYVIFHCLVRDLRDLFSLLVSQSVEALLGRVSSSTDDDMFGEQLIAISKDHSLLIKVNDLCVKPDLGSVVGVNQLLEEL